MEKEKRPRGRPVTGKAKKHVTIRIDSDIYNLLLKKFKTVSLGINSVLSDFFKKK